MEGRPRSIYAVPRPLRVAYLIPSSNDGIDIAVATITYLQSILAGRYCPIIATDGHTIAPSDISLLLHYDPDVVKALTPLSDSLIRSLDAMLSPFAVEMQYSQPGQIWPVHPQITDAPLTIDQNIDQISISGLAWGNKSQRVKFVCNKNTDNMIHRFLSVNFGIIPSEAKVEQLPVTADSLTLQVNSWSDLASAFAELNSFKPRFFPIQMSALPNTLPDTQHSDGRFCVVVGDSLDDILRAWNRILDLPQGFRTSLRTVWVPRELFEHNDVARMFARWAKTITDAVNFGDLSFVFTSASMTEDEVAIFAGSFRSQISDTQVVRTSGTLREIDWQHTASELGPNNGSLYPVIANRAIVKAELPAGPVVTQLRRHWMIDLHVEIDETSQSIRFNSLRWLRWAKSAVIRHRVAPPGAGRIMGGGVLSICVDSPDISLDVQLPESLASLLIPLIAADRSPRNPSDPRSRIFQNSQYGVQKSEKGRYLEGFIEAFGGLDNAFEVLSQPFWREVFERMSGASPQKNTNLVQQVSNKLKKPKFNKPLTDSHSDLLAKYILDKARQAILRSKEFTMVDFGNALKKHIDRYNSGNLHEVLAPDNEVLQSKIDELVQCNALIQGLRPRCQRCGWPNWLAAGTFGREIACTGCGITMRIPAEPTWYYRLNSLIQDGISQHGLVAVTLVLGALQRDSYQSFIALPSVDIFDGRDNITDLDIACAQDGSLIIGEIKTSVGLFEPADFSKMEKVARRINPGKLLFSSLDLEPDDKVDTQIVELRAKLASQGTAVEWYSLPSNVFDLHPFYAKPSDILDQDRASDEISDIEEEIGTNDVEGGSPPA